MLKNHCQPCGDQGVLCHATSPHGLILPIKQSGSLVMVPSKRERERERERESLGVLLSNILKIVWLALLFQALLLSVRCTLKLLIHPLAVKVEIGVTPEHYDFIIFGFTCPNSSCILAPVMSGSLCATTYDPALRAKWSFCRHRCISVPCIHSVNCPPPLTQSLGINRPMERAYLSVVSDVGITLCAPPKRPEPLNNGMDESIENRKINTRLDTHPSATVEPAMADFTGRYSGGSHSSFSEFHMIHAPSELIP